jgi:adenylosuccinate synthase
MANCVVLGMQWGDEGKGKIIDLITPSFDAVARYQGGPNAGHTVYVKGKKIILHLIPSGILHENKLCLIGNGVVFNPESFLNEMEQLRDYGVKSFDNIAISKNAHLILPYHFEIESLLEERMGDNKIGTTLRGIGPAYVDKLNRCGIKVGDLLNEGVLKEKIELNVTEKNEYLTHFGRPRLDANAIISKFMDYAAQIRMYIKDVSYLLNQKMREGYSVLIEGAQGTLLDIDHGTYPFVTSSNPTIGGVCTGLGISPYVLDAVFGVSKAYNTRVGSGPFPTEIIGETGDYLREKGSEFGATTGRPRRCGWYDAVAAAYAVRLNGIKRVILTKADVLDGLDELKICEGYKYKGGQFPSFPTEKWILEQVEPQYRTVKGWKEPIDDIRDFESLPQAFKDYIANIEELIQAEVAIISTGKDRHQTVFRDEKLEGLVDLEAVRATQFLDHS